MNMYAVHFEDDPSKHSVRLEQQNSHEQYLRGYQDKLVSAGTLSRDGETALGGIWILRADNEIEVREVIEGDPFFIHEIRRTIRIWQYQAL